MGVTVGDDEHALLFRFSPYLFSLYLGFHGRWLYGLTKWLRRGDYEPREISLRIFDWAIWIDIWAKSMSWSSTQPWWMSMRWHPMDSLFGRTKHSAEEIGTTVTVIPMPERAYPCTVVMKREAWKRPRLPWTSYQNIRAHIDCKDGVPHPGKGESSWDCGDDATYSLTCEAKTVEEGIGKFVQSVLRDRRRYGGSVNWRQKQSDGTSSQLNVPNT